MVPQTSYRTKYQSSPGKNEIEIGKSTIDRITQARTFEPHDRPKLGSEFFIFRRRGDSIRGILGHPIENYQRNTSYPLTLENGRIVEIFGNKLLHRLIQRHELIGSRVRIVYIGRQFIGQGHARKIYRVYKIKGCITQYESYVGETKNG